MKKLLFDVWRLDVYSRPVEIIRAGVTSKDAQQIALNARMMYKYKTKILPAGDEPKRNPEGPYIRCVSEGRARVRNPEDMDGATRYAAIRTLERELHSGRSDRGA